MEGKPIKAYTYTYMYMSKLVNISDEAYEKLTRIKRSLSCSYSSAILGLIEKEKKGTFTHADILEEVKLRQKLHKGKKEKVDIDKVVYGVSRDDS